MTNEKMANDQPLGSSRGVSPFLPVGTEIAAYRIESFVERGGMAFVYEATDLRLDRRVALKVLTPELSPTVEFRERFLRESRFAASLDHPNIVPIYEAGEADGLLYMAMRYVRGGDLGTLIRQHGRLEPTRTLAILSPVANALDAAHAAGLVHRDVKPGNILVTSAPGEHVYLSDFGLTKRASALSTLTATGYFTGTIDYVAPEQIRGEPLGSRTDLYAFGCVAYQCLTGTPPFVCDNQVALLWAHLNEVAAPVSSHRGELSAVDPVVATALAKDPDDRYQTCAQFVTALAGALRPDQHLVSAAAAPLDSAAEVETTPPLGAAGETPATLPREVPSARHAQQQAGEAVAASPADKEPEQAPPLPSGDRQPPRRRRWRLAGVATATVGVVLLAVLGAGAMSSGTSPKASSASASAAAANPLGTAAVAAADTTLRSAKQVEAALREHTDIMNRLDSGQLTSQQAATLGMPSIMKGAAASAQFNQTLGGYQQATTKYRAATAAATPSCTLALAAADTTLRSAKQVEAALREHTDIMNRLDSGQLTSQQAATLGMPSIMKGAAASAQFNQTLGGYQQATTKCR